MSMLKKLSVVAVAVLFVAGCASMAKGPSDEELIVQTVMKLKEALETQDIDLLMETFADDFEHPEVGGKEDGRMMLEMGMEAGYADDGEVYLDDMEIAMNDDGTATVYPVDLSAAMGSIAVELVMAKRGEQWLIITLDADI